MSTDLHLTPEQILAMTVGTLAQEPAEFLFALKSVAAARLENAKAVYEHLETATDRKWSDRARALRQDLGKDNGVVHFDDGDVHITADLPKKVEYDQRKLKEAVEALRKWGEDPEHYVKLEVKVAESKYTAWPPAVRQLFDPARTLKTGKPTYKLERLVDVAGPEAANNSHFGGGV